MSNSTPASTATSKATSPPPDISMTSVLQEHFIKGAIYTAILTNAIRSLFFFFWDDDGDDSSSKSKTSLSSSSLFIHSAIGLWSLWMLHGEILFIRRRIQKKLPPGMIGYPILREIKFIMALTTKGGLVQGLLKNKANFGTMFTTNSPFGISIIAGGVDDLTWLFRQDRKTMTDVSWPPNIQLLLGQGAVANQVGKYHRVLRRLLEPYFAPTFVQNYAQIMDTTTQEELKKWSSETTRNGDKFLSGEVFKGYALRLFFVSSFGTIDDEDVLNQLHHDFGLWIQGFFSLTGTTRIPGTSFDEAMKAKDRILQVVDGLIDKFQAENPEGSERAETTIVGRLIYGKDTTATTATTTGNPDGQQRALSRAEMKDNILNLIFAGHDTTYASISTVLHHLAGNPDTLQALTEELAGLKNVEILDPEELKNDCPILNAVIFESWRMDPPVPGGFRKIQKPMNESSYKGCNFDKGTLFNYSILLPVLDESIYKQADKFCMERFLPKDHALYRQELDTNVDPRQGKPTYPIFGGGTHVCLGKAFAILELRILLARLLRDYNLKVRNDQKVDFPVNGWSIEFQLEAKQ